MKLRSGNHRGGKSWAGLTLRRKLSRKPPLGLSMAAYPTSSRQRSDSSPSPPPSIPLANRSFQPPRLTASSSASQQLPNNAGPDNRLPCRLQVCQPWACQITVSVNQEGWGWERKRGKKWMWSGVERVEPDVSGGTRWGGGGRHIWAHVQKEVWHIFCTCR